jgi:hypothetical protein
VCSRDAQSARAVPRVFETQMVIGVGPRSFWL